MHRGGSASGARAQAVRVTALIGLALHVVAMAGARIVPARAASPEAVPAAGAAVTVSFDDVSAPATFRETVPLTSAYSDLGVTFSGPTTIDGGAILNDKSGYGVTGYSPPNFLAFNDEDSAYAQMESGGYPVTPEALRFSPPVSQVSLEVGTGSDPDWAGTVTATAYDPQGRAVATMTVTLASTLVTLTLKSDQIDTLVLTTTSQAFVIDDLSFTQVADTDQDGDLDPDDCDPDDPSRYHGAQEICDGIDQNCEGGIDEGFTDTDSDSQADCIDADDDNDGSPDEEDCGPEDPGIYPGAAEVCDDIDQDCDGDLIDGYPDADQDSLPDCIDADDDNDGSPDGEDCAPLERAIHPGVAEECDGIDQDCDAVTDDGYPDGDGDGQADCIDADDDADGYDDVHDCAANDPAIHPDAFEACDGVDNNCDGIIDPLEVCGEAGDDDTADGDDTSTASGAGGDDDATQGMDDSGGGSEEDGGAGGCSCASAVPGGGAGSPRRRETGTAIFFMLIATFSYSCNRKCR